MSDQTPRQIENVEGVVKWFDPKKGFGFIIGPEGQDVFIHFTKIEGEGFRVLRDGGKVTYDAVETDKGWQATRVVRHPDPEVQVRTSRSRARSPRR